MMGNTRSFWSILQRAQLTGTALAIATAMAVSMPAVAMAAPSISPETAGEKRDAIRESAAESEKKEDWEAMADSLESDAKQLGDPLTLMESADARLKYAAAERSVDACNQAIDTTRVALDILHFYDAVSTGGARSRWRVIDPDLASSLIEDADAQIVRAEALIEEIEEEEAEAAKGVAAVASTGPKKDDENKDDKKKRKKREPLKPGTALIITGAVAGGIGLAGAAVGFAGLAIGSSKDKDVKKLTPGPDQDEIDQTDQEGKNANIMAVVAIPAGGGLVVVGVALLVVGALKRKKGGGAGKAARLNAAPMIGRTNGIAITGRF